MKIISAGNLRAAVVIGVLAAAVWLVPLACGRLWGNRSVVVYARAVDQDGIGVARAEFQATVIRLPWLVPPLLYSDQSHPTIHETMASANDDGDMIFDGGEGVSATLAVGRAGYFGNPVVEIEFPPHRGHVQPAYDRHHPLLFRLWRLKHPEPLLRGKFPVRLTRDGTPVFVDLITGIIGSTERDGDISFSVMTPPTVSYHDQTAWWCEIIAKDGGMVETADLYPFIAPETGYERIRRYEFGPQNAPSAYDGELKRTYFFVGRGGQLYGTLHVTIDPSMSPDAEAMLDYVVNPAGSRNLEPGQEKDIVPPTPPRRRPRH